VAEISVSAKEGEKKNKSVDSVYVQYERCFIPAVKIKLTGTRGIPEVGGVREEGIRGEGIEGGFEWVILFFRLT
jgi:hypothetical protein